jgi:DNA-binding MarR family transcriptional regulator
MTLPTRIPSPAGREANRPHRRPAPPADVASELLDALRALDRALRLQRGAAARRTVHPAELAALRCLADAPGPLSLGELAECLHLDPSSVSVVVSKLTARGLVRKRISAEDRRRCEISATAVGRREADRAPDGEREALERALPGWPAHRVREAARLISHLAGALTVSAPVRPVAEA